MKKSQFTPEQITFAIRQAEGGTPVPEIYRKMGIVEQTDQTPVTPPSVKLVLGLI